MCNSDAGLAPSEIVQIVQSVQLSDEVDYRGESAVNAQPDGLLDGFLGRGGEKHDDCQIPNYSVILKEQGKKCGLRINDACVLGVRVMSSNESGSRYVR